MKVYNQDKTQELTDCDLENGYLQPDTIEISYPEIQAVEEQFHWETIKEYPNGGKDLKRVVDVEGVEYQPARTEVVDIYVYIPYTENELLERELNRLRELRELECFPVINRGQLWYSRLTDWQKSELEEWYQKWLDVTNTEIIPEKPSWLK